jgi:NhaC family Na+:H+ antiporter
MIEEVGENLKSTTGAIIILLFVGALAGSWLISGIIPAMIYYGLQILHPSIFLPATVVISAVISLATGSSWTTSATVGIALIGIGQVMGMNIYMVGGAVISGAYFGDKMSPLSDTTNLAPAMAGAELFSHIRYMAYTTIPTITITIIVFAVLNFTQTTSGTSDNTEMLASISDSFNINGWLFIVPVVVILLIVRKTKPIIALLIGTLSGAVFAIIFQPDIVKNITGAEVLSFKSAYQGTMVAMTEGTSIATENKELNDLFSAGGMSGMMGTIWLIICAMVFGGVMDAIGALDRISRTLLSMAKSTFGLFASTVASCLALNVTASDQYLAIVVPGKMFAKAYRDKGLAPENLSRTLEDSGTVTSVLVPWNTCGAYQSQVLFGEAGVLGYIPYAIFNWLSPFMTLFFAAVGIKIKTLVKGTK